MPQGYDAIPDETENTERGCFCMGNPQRGVSKSFQPGGRFFKVRYLKASVVFGLGLLYYITESVTIAARAELENDNDAYWVQCIVNTVCFFCTLAWYFLVFRGSPRNFTWNFAMPAPFCFVFFGLLTLFQVLITISDAELDQQVRKEAIKKSLLHTGINFFGYGFQMLLHLSEPWTLKRQAPSYLSKIRNEAHQVYSYSFRMLLQTYQAILVVFQLIFTLLLVIFTTKTEAPLADDKLDYFQYLAEIALALQVAQAGIQKFHNLNHPTDEYTILSWRFCTLSQVKTCLFYRLHHHIDWSAPDNTEELFDIFDTLALVDMAQSKDGKSTQTFMQSIGQYRDCRIRANEELVNRDEWKNLEERFPITPVILSADENPPTDLQLSPPSGYHSNLSNQSNQSTHSRGRARFNTFNDSDSE